MDLNSITGKIIGAACKVHSALGPGLLEEPYKQCLKHQLTKIGLCVLSEGTLPVRYDGVTIDIGYRIDLLVEGAIVVELKSVEKLNPVNKIQLLTYLRISNKRLGLLLNFNVQSLKHSIVSVINSHSAQPCVLCA
jgi:GxxExxY protein